MIPEKQKNLHLGPHNSHIAQLLAEKALLERRILALDEALGMDAKPSQKHPPVRLDIQPPRNWHSN
jgi:hypothetical protein